MGTTIKVTLKSWLDYLESQVNVTLYVWGANDELCVNLMNRLVAMEKDDHTEKQALTNINRTLTLLQKRLLQGCDILKIRCADCSGLAVGFLLKAGIIKSDKRAEDLYQMLKKRAVKLANVQAGDYLFRGTEDKKTHVGYAVDNKWAVESKDHDVGVVKTRISERGWGWACRPDWYEDSPEPTPVYVLTRELYLTDPYMRGEDVREVQERLNELNYYCGEADGIFGNKTNIAVKNFQSDRGLTIDGIVGKYTTEALGFIWEG